MKTTCIKNFDQFINENLASDVGSKILGAVTSNVNDKMKAKAKTYLNLDFGTLIKRTSANLTTIFATYITKVTSANLDPLTIPAEAVNFEREIYALVDKEINTIKVNLPGVTKTAFALMKSTWKDEFETQNGNLNGPIYQMVEAIINVFSAQSKSGGEQLIKGGKLVKPFSLPVNNDKRTYGSITYGCYTDDYYRAFVEQLWARQWKITQTLVTNISNKLFA